MRDIIAMVKMETLRMIAEQEAQQQRQDAQAPMVPLTTDWAEWEERAWGESVTVPARPGNRR